MAPWLLPGPLRPESSKRTQPYAARVMALDAGEQIEAVLALVILGRVLGEMEPGEPWPFIKMVV